MGISERSIAGWKSARRLVAGERQQRDHPRLFDGGGQLTLMLGARAGVTARVNFPAIRNELPQAAGVLVVNDDVIFGAELAHLLLQRLAPEFAWSSISVSVHND